MSQSNAAAGLTWQLFCISSFASAHPSRWVAQNSPHVVASVFLKWMRAVHGARSLQMLPFFTAAQVAGSQAPMPDRVGGCDGAEVRRVVTGVGGRVGGRVGDRAGASVGRAVGDPEVGAGVVARPVAPSQKSQAFAKALHYWELQYDTNPETGIYKPRYLFVYS